MYYVKPVDVSKIIINEAKGKEPEQYVLKNLDLNMQNKTVSEPIKHTETYSTVNSTMRGTERNALGLGGDYSSSLGNIQEYNVDATHMVHAALTEGMDNDFPFGASILDSIFKTYKQKELLEDSIIIYRVQRAPERRVFYVDVGNMPANKAMGFVERVKNEIHQKRIPSKTGGGNSIMDSAYNPLSIKEDYFFAQTAEGRGSKVEVLPGGENLGQIDDIIYFQKRLYKSLNVPVSRLEQEQASGLLGRSTEINRDELKFQKFIDRLRRRFSGLFLEILKKQLMLKGIITSEDWEVWQNDIIVDYVSDNHFAELRNAELVRERLQTLDMTQQYVGEFYSKAWVMKNVLNLNEDDIEQMKKEMAEEMAAGEVGHDDDHIGQDPDQEEPGENPEPKEKTKEKPKPKPKDSDEE